MGILTYLRHRWVQFHERMDDWWQGSALAGKARRRIEAEHTSEAERLDRIRQPHKYLGKP